MGRALVLLNSTLSRGMVGPEPGGFLLELSKQQQGEADIGDGG